MRDPQHEDEQPVVLDRVDDAVITHANPQEVAARQVLRARRPWFDSKVGDLREDAPLETLVEIAKGLSADRLSSIL